MEEMGQPPPQIGANLHSMHFSIFIISLSLHIDIPLLESSSDGKNFPIDTSLFPMDSGHV